VALSGRSWLQRIILPVRDVVLCLSVGRTIDLKLAIEFMHLKLTRVNEVLRAVRVPAFLLLQGMVLLHL